MQKKSNIYTILTYTYIYEEGLHVYETRMGHKCDSPKSEKN